MPPAALATGDLDGLFPVATRPSWCEVIATMTATQRRPTGWWGVRSGVGGRGSGCRVPGALTGAIYTARCFGSALKRVATAFLLTVTNPGNTWIRTGSGSVCRESVNHDPAPKYTHIRSPVVNQKLLRGEREFISAPPNATKLLGETPLWLKHWPSCGYKVLIQCELYFMMELVPDRPRY